MLEGTIKVFECGEFEESKFGGEPYCKIEGKLAGINNTWLSEVKLTNGEHNVKVKVTLYQGKYSLKIVSLA